MSVYEIISIVGTYVLLLAALVGAVWTIRRLKNGEDHDGT